MTGARSRFGGMKAATAALAILYAATALAILATASRSDGPVRAGSRPAANLVEHGFLGR